MFTRGTQLLTDSCMLISTYQRITSNLLIRPTLGSWAFPKSSHIMSKLLDINHSQASVFCSNQWVAIMAWVRMASDWWIVVCWCFASCWQEPNNMFFLYAILEPLPCGNQTYLAWKWGPIFNRYINHLEVVSYPASCVSIHYNSSLTIIKHD